MKLEFLRKDPCIQRAIDRLLPFPWNRKGANAISVTSHFNNENGSSRAKANSKIKSLFIIFFFVERVHNKTKLSK